MSAENNALDFLHTKKPPLPKGPTYRTSDITKVQFCFWAQEYSDLQNIDLKRRIKQLEERLDFFVNREVDVHGESENVDFIVSSKELISKY